MWTKRSYDAVFNWVDESKRPGVVKILMADGLESVVERLTQATNMGVWYGITNEARDDVGGKVVQDVANEAEISLSAIASAFGKNGENSGRKFK